MGRTELEHLEARASQPRRVESENIGEDDGGLDPDQTSRLAEDRERQVDAAIDSTDPLNAASMEALVAAFWTKSITHLRRNHVPSRSFAKG